MFNINTNVNNLNEIVQSVITERDSIILKQLNDLISQGLLVVEEGPVSFYQDSMKAEVCCKQTIKLTIKDKEYIEKLEKENDLLREQLKELKQIWRKENKK